MNEIRPISKSSIHRLCSGQVILSLATATKELVENAVDSGATNVEVRLREYGSELIEVSDNGSGISPAHYQAVTLRYHTSKIKEFSDLQNVATFGFRGEALSSLCCISEVSIVTRTVGQKVGVRLEYDKDGVLVNQTPTARGVGTTVAVKDIFKALPVRCQEMKRNIKREYSKLLQVLQAYALTATNMRMICSNQYFALNLLDVAEVNLKTGNRTRNTAFTTQYGSTLRKNIMTLFGPRIADGLVPLDMEIPTGGKITGYVSKAKGEAGKSRGDRQFFYLNGRPVDLPKASRVLNECFRSLCSVAGPSGRPMAIIDFQVPRDTTDVNVTPDKRMVFIQNEKEILEVLQQAVEELWEPSRYTYAVSTSPLTQSFTPKMGNSQNPFLSQPCPTPRKDAFNTQVSDPTQLTQCATPKTEAFNTQMPYAGHSAQCTTPKTEMDTERVLDSGGVDEVEMESDNEEDVAAHGSRLEAFSLKRKKPGADLIEDAPNDLSANVTPVRKSLEDFAMPQPVPTQPRGGEASKRRAVQKNMKDYWRPVEEVNTVTRTSYEGVKMTENEVQMDVEQGSPVKGSQDQDMVDSDETDDVDGGGNEFNESDQGVRCIESSPNLKREKWPGSCQEADEKVEDQDLDEDDSIDGSVEPKGVGDQDEIIASQNSDKVDIKPSIDLRDAEDENLDAIQGNDGDDVGNLGPESVMETDSDGRAKIQFDLDDLMSHWNEYIQDKEETSLKKGLSNFEAASLQESLKNQSASDRDATEELKRVFTKSNFAKMQIIGQFNLGFILARLGQDIFIVDQHASDEKHTFERLVKTTVLSQQPLVVPKPLNLSAVEECVMRSNMDVFKMNGFRFQSGTSGELMLSAVPFSKNTTFGADDVAELTAQIQNDIRDTSMAVGSKVAPGKEITQKILRPSRVRSMLAMRACRSSIMIGKHLNRQQMQKILVNLSGLDAPWNCPHGRPTMRHLCLIPDGECEEV